MSDKQTDAQREIVESLLNRIELKLMEVKSGNVLWVKVSGATLSDYDILGDLRGELEKRGVSNVPVMVTSNGLTDISILNDEDLATVGLQRIKE